MVQASLDGKTTLPLLDDRLLGTTHVDARRKHLQFDPPLRPGKFVIQFSYELPWQSDSSPGPGRQRVRVPLIEPEQWRECQLKLTAKDGFSARPVATAEGPWRAVPGEPPLLQAVKPVAEVSLDVVWGTVVVHRLWLDSWLFPDKRIDQLVCNFTSDRHPLRLRLPSGAASSLQATLDGKPLRQVSVEDDLFEVAASEATRTLELRYEVAAGASGLTSLLEPARPTEEAWVRETYWRLVLPERRYLLWSPHGVQREFSWKWQTWGWERTNPPLADEGDDLGLPEGVNAYLFSTLGPPPAIRVAAVDVFWLVIVASGLAFVAAAVAIAVPAVRRREVLLACTVVLLVAAVLYPEPFLLVAQAASLGLVAALLFLTLKLLVSISRPFVMRAPSGSIRGSTRGSAMAPSGVIRGSSRARLSKRPGAAGGSSRAAAPQSQPAPAATTEPVVAAEVASAGSSRPSDALAQGRGA
jgi:hypothetical protein